MCECSNLNAARQTLRIKKPFKHKQLFLSSFYFCSPFTMQMNPEQCERYFQNRRRKQKKNGTRQIQQTLGVRSTPPSYNALHFSFIFSLSSTHLISSKMHAEPCRFDRIYMNMIILYSPHIRTHSFVFVLQTNKQSNQSRFSINSICTYSTYIVHIGEKTTFCCVQWNTKNCVDFITVANVNTHTCTHI